ncbi:hypothetical protein V2J09_005348 [Rumex salicifolius]
MESPSSSTSKSSNQEEENHTQGSLIHGVEHVGMKAYVYKKPSLHTKDVQVKNEDRDQEKFITYLHMLCMQSKCQRQAPILDRARQNISQALEWDPTGPHEDGSAPSEV